MFEPPDTITDLASAIDRRLFAPLRRPRTRRVGVELELPVWNLTPGKATDFDAVHAATEEFLARFDFPDTALDDTGALYRARAPNTEDELSFDCSFNTLELSFGPDEDLTAVHARFLDYYPVLQEAFNRRGHALTGMGINPRWRENRPEPIGNGRYRMLLHHLKSYSKYGGSPRFHDHPDFGLFSCASQAQVDVCENTVVPTINAFNTLEPFKAVLFANSPFGDRGEFLCGRDQLWSHSLHGLNPHNCGMYGGAWPTFIDRPALVMQLHRILDLSAKGLARRGFGEEPLLDPLRRRADMLTNPALEQLDRLAHGESIENIARDYGALSSGKKARHA